MRLACDTGGTFTDLVVEDEDGSVELFKSPTTPGDPGSGVLNVLALAAASRGRTLADFLGAARAMIHGTTHAINAVVTGRTARTAFLTTRGHPDILTLREGGRGGPFDHHLTYPESFVSRALTFEVDERIAHDGSVVTPLDEDALVAVLKTLADKQVEAVACCLLWSISNPAHEERVGALIEAHLPGIPYTLSHRLNPSLREYRRAISTAIDASLKPIMTRYLGSLQGRLTAAGFAGQLLVQTSQGGMVDAAELAHTPIHSLNSGPSLAPIAGRFIAAAMETAADVIVADTGGTTYDVTLIRDGRIPMTRETWIGRPHEGVMTGFPSVDVKSVGAGGGSIAWLDDAGLLRVGPASAGARPGAACFGHGGDRPTLTDAALLLGYIDPEFFLGGAMALDVDAARRAMATVADPLGVTLEAAALAVYDIATENMVQAIQDITVRQGIDPADAVLIGGGGAAGLNSTMIGRRLGCRQVAVPFVGACLSATGALLSDIGTYFRDTRFCTTADFPAADINARLDALAGQCRRFAERAGGDPATAKIAFHVEARYPNQVWEIDVPFAGTGFAGPADIAALEASFHATHRALFGFDEPHSPVEIVTWCASVDVVDPARRGTPPRLREGAAARDTRIRPMWFAGAEAAVPTPVHDFGSLRPGETLSGPAVVETPFTTVVIDPAASFTLHPDAGLVIQPGDAA